MKYFDSVKLAGMNLFAWLFAAVNLSDVKDLAAIAASIGALGVSIVSIWYIRKKGISLDKPKD